MLGQLPGLGTAEEEEQDGGDGGEDAVLEAGGEGVADTGHGAPALRIEAEVGHWICLERRSSSGDDGEKVAIGEDRHCVCPACSPVCQHRTFRRIHGEHNPLSSKEQVCKQKLWWKPDRHKFMTRI